MMTCEDANLERLVLHKVGNKANGELLTLSSAPYILNPDISSLLLKYFTSPFKGSQYYVFSSDSSVGFNGMYNTVCNIFDDVKTNLYTESCNIARHLYDVSTHPNIKSGEMYITYMSQCYLDGEIVDAVGIFKSETKETYLKVFPQGDNFDIEQDNGININKLDKGCIVFNKDRENGFVVAVVDNTSKGNEAVYWIDDFLSLRQRQDSFFKTENMLSLCKNFVVDYLPKKYNDEISKADQAEILNRTSAYFKENKNFNTENFSEKVMEDAELKDVFREYKGEYEKEYEMNFDDDFILNEEALKKASRYLRSVIKLDKNFTVYIHGKRDRVETGIDEERGLRYYKLYFEKES
ncbi:MAG: nucleoid-associated protein [Bacteroidales bacterium]|nr:nucleoid-associated protein [Bacteroidales bacterium]